MDDIIRTATPPPRKFAKVCFYQCSMENTAQRPETPEFVDRPFRKFGEKQLFWEGDAADGGLNSVLNYEGEHSDDAKPARACGARAASSAARSNSALFSVKHHLNTFSSC